MASHNDLGNKGEQLATEYLQGNGYQILSANWRYLKAEIDIIARIGNVICVVEVKTRSTSEFGNPQEFVKPKQIGLLVSAINNYIEDIEDDVEIRFDIVAIVKNKLGTTVEHLEDAFMHF